MSAEAVSSGVIRLLNLFPIQLRAELLERLDHLLINDLLGDPFLRLHTDLDGESEVPEIGDLADRDPGCSDSVSNAL